jgi:hypothetical protein
MSVYHYALDIYTDNSTTDSTYGMVSGVFRFVTDRPNYDGATVVPTYGPDEIDFAGNSIGGTPITDVYYEGFLLKEFCSSNPSRSIDITSCGSYSTDSQFGFKIKNNPMFWKFCRDYAIHLTGCKVTMYVVIDDIFYQISRGRIVNNPYTEADYEFTIDDDATLIHKTLPPKVVTITKTPAVVDVNGNIITPAVTEQVVIPVIFGNVPYTLVAKLSESNAFINLNVPIQNMPLTLAAASSYTVDTVNDDYYINLVVSGHDFIINELQGCYLTVVAGLNCNQDIIYRIEESAASQAILGWSGYSLLQLKLYDPMVQTDGLTLVPAWSTGDQRSIKTTPTRATYPNTFWFKISSFKINTIVTNTPYTTLLVSDYNGDIFLWGWDSSLSAYSSIKNLVDSSSNASTLNLLSNTATADGKIIKQEIVNFPMIIFGYIGNVNEVHGGADVVTVGDKNRTTGINMSADLVNKSTVFIFANYINQTFSNINIPANYTYDNYYFCVDFDIIGRDPARSWSLTSVGWATWDIYKLNNQIKNTPVVATFNSPNEPYNNTFNTVPNDLMLNVGTDTSNLFGKKSPSSTTQTMRVFLKVPDPPFSESNVEYVQLNLGVAFTGTTATKLRIKSINVIGERKVDTISGDVYARAYGEWTGVSSTHYNSTNNVYDTFIHILEDYDGIPKKLIDYTNLNSERIDWNIGRTLTEQKISVDYLNELASQSFVGIFTNRLGKRTLNAFNNFDAPVTTSGTGKTQSHDDSIIVRDSIESFEKTDMAQVYNSFNLKYCYDPGSKEYLKAFNITNIGLTSTGSLQVFPSSSAVDSNGDLLWKQYFSGINQYAEAKLLWDSCQSSYTINGVVKPAQNDLNELPWFTDTALFNQDILAPGVTTSGWGSGLMSSAYYLLKLLIQWTTLQKYKVTYSIPLNANTINTELLDIIEFSDTYYTDGNPHFGWITSVEVDPVLSQLKLTALLLPDEIQTDNLIIEGDHQDDTIDEDDHQADTVLEEGV